MTLRLTIVLLAYSSSVFGQQVNLDTLIIRTAIAEFDGQPITYLNHSGNWGNLESQLDTLEFYNDLKSHSLVLTETEREMLLKQARKQSLYPWPDELLKGSRKIEVDSIWTYLKSAKPKRGRAWVFGFSKPIFFRQNTFCLFAYMARCGEDCGHAETAFYKKEGDTWEQWIIISAGAW